MTMREAWEPVLRQYGVRYAVDAVRTPEFREAMNRHAVVLNVIRSRLELLQVGAAAPESTYTGIRGAEKVTAIGPTSE